MKAGRRKPERSRRIGRTHTKPVMLDEEPDGTGGTGWRAAGPAAGRIRKPAWSRTATEAVGALRNALPGRRIIVCPRTPAGRRQARQAASIHVDTAVSGYQVRIYENGKSGRRWEIHWYGKPEGRSRTTGCSTAAEAVTRIRKRIGDPAVRIATTTREGAAEAAGLAAGHNVFVENPPAV